MTTERRLLVYVDLATGTQPVGTLYMRARQRSQSASFEYQQSWLQHASRFALDPVHLPLGRGSFHTARGQRLFPGLTDSAPDRWGRMLMAREQRLGGAKRTLFEADYLTMVHDQTRQGATRFKQHADGPFLADNDAPIPPLVKLGELLAASDQVQKDASDIDALRVLLAPGSSLGGARPKASVLDVHGNLAIAKFPTSSDDWPVIQWEHITHVLARAAGITVPDTQLLDLADRRVLLTPRFDRRAGYRVPFLSAMALIGADDGDEQHSYLEIVDAIRQHGENIAANLRELWRRMLFNVLVSNTDDHLRNHGLLRGEQGWTLSPAYDLNPVPLDVKPRIHALTLDESSAASFATVVNTAPYFGLERGDVRTICDQVTAAVSQWRRIAGRHGLNASAVERMASAFEHDDLDDARRMAASG